MGSQFCFIRLTYHQCLTGFFKDKKVHINAYKALFEKHEAHSLNDLREDGEAKPDGLQ